MSKALKKEYLEKIKKRYRKASKKEKKTILDEFCFASEYDRKYAIKLLSPKTVIKKATKKKGPAIVYDNLVTAVLRIIWLATGQICSKRLVTALPLWLPFYEHEYGAISLEIREKLHKISSASIDRKLKPIKAKYKHKGLSGTKPGSLLKNQIPIKTDNWDITKPGFVEADTVAHCGKSLLGDFAWSLTMTDIFSHWTENRATWGKGSFGVREQINDIENNLFFEILGFDCDNGSEFLNWHLWRYFVEDRKKQPVQFTRSREYHKNDNAHVEQKNWTHVRQLFGYDRFDNKDVIELMNNLYRNEWSQYQNYFLPTMKLFKKERINSKNKKHHEISKTPYQRLLDSENITIETKEKLKMIYATLNPFTLKRIIEKKLSTILNIATVSSIMRQ